MWVRGLKLIEATSNRVSAESHLMWVRGLKQYADDMIYCLKGRTLCGCVD